MPVTARGTSSAKVPHFAAKRALLEARSRPRVLASGRATADQLANEITALDT